MVTTLAKKAMTTKGQKACFVIDHLVEALGNEPSSSLRRAMILVDIDQYPGTTPTAIMERLMINKSTVTREVEWLFSYGCISRRPSPADARAHELSTVGYCRKAVEAALDYCDGEHRNLKMFLEQMIKTIKLEKPTLRDAKIIATLYERKKAPRSEVVASLYKGSASSDYRALNELLQEGLVEDAA